MVIELDQMDGCRLVECGGWNEIDGMNIDKVRLRERGKPAVANATESTVEAVFLLSELKITAFEMLVRERRKAHS